MALSFTLMCTIQYKRKHRELDKEQQEQDDKFK